MVVMMKSVILDRIAREYKRDLLESALTVVIGDEIIKPELVDSCIGAEGHYNLMYRRKDKSKHSCGFSVTLETLYGDDLEKNVYTVKTAAKELMLKGELNDE